MKIVYRYLIISIVLFIFFPNISFATNDEIINSQMKNLNIESFVSEASKYTSEVVKDTDSGEKILEKLIAGEFNNKDIFKNIFEKIFREFSNYIGSMRISFNSNNTL